MPKVDMVMETGTFVEWLKQEGDQVEKGDPLFVIMTDKASIEIEAPATGLLGGVAAQTDDVIPVSQVIGYILEPGEAVPAAAAAASAEAVAEAVAEPQVAAQPQEAATPETVAAPASVPGGRPMGIGLAPEGKVRATPVARRLAARMGIDLTLVTGRGPRGRIHKADVLALAAQTRYAEQPPAAGLPAAAPATAPAVQVPLPAARQKEVVPLVGPRKIIAERMAYSAFTAPHITLTLSVDMTEAARLRSRLLDSLQQRTGQRLSYTAILARAVASVLPRHAYLNASLNGEEIILWDDVHLGIATSLEDYLIVPVIREAQSMGLEQLVVDLADLVERARAKRLTPSEMAGSTFTISNLGMFGIESFTAIINPPESAILAVGKIAGTPQEVEEQIELRPVMQMTLSADHRIVDGAAGARFLADLKATLENPYLLI
jgi:pyruvate dehydrogenase E2 component (dihydrolipoamide acetyltransferase)